MTKLLKDLPVGALVRDKDSRIVKSNYEGDLIWRIVDKNYKLYPGKSVTLITDKNIANIQYTNSDPSYLSSNVRKWLGSETRFMSWLSNDLKENLLTTRLNDLNISEKVFLASFDEVLPTSSSRLAYFTDTNKCISRDLNDRVESWFVRDTGWDHYQYLITKNGERDYAGKYTNYGTRPLCNVNENIKVSDTPDSKGVYNMIWNQPPKIRATNTQLGTVKADFDIRYTVSDPDGDKVKVQVMVDDRVIQYPMETPLDREQVVRIRLSDYALGNHTVTVTASDTNNASDSVTYYFTKSNQAPTISGYDLDLGGVFKDVSVDYIVQDANGDAVEVKISLDGAIKQPFTQTTLGVRKTFNLPIKSVELGRHRLEIEARDSQGASSVRTYTFEKVNSAPIISGNDVNLGAKNTAFSYKYSIMDNESDNVKVVEKLNGSIIRTVYNITLGQEQIITISDEQIREMELHKQNTIEIEASDGTATVYRRINFTRNNMPPIISDQDKDLGILTDKFEYKFSATDPEDDTMVYTVSLDDRILVDREPIPDGREKSILIEGLDWLKIRATKHTIKIFVEDDKGFKSVRTINFTRKVDRIVVQLANKGIATDEIASRVFISDAGMYSAKGAITKIEVCNNSFDTNPAWEDATTMFKAGKAYNFLNKEKIAEKAGINIRVTIEKGESTAPSYITATGGSFD